jgi:hypothetical protein
VLIQRRRPGGGARRRNHGCAQATSATTRPEAHKQGFPLPPKGRSFNTAPPPSRAPTASLRDRASSTLDTDDTALKPAKAGGEGAVWLSTPHHGHHPADQEARLMHASARQTSPNQLRMWSRAELVDRLTAADPQPATCIPATSRPRKATKIRPSTGRETSSASGTRRDTTSRSAQVSTHEYRTRPKPSRRRCRTGTADLDRPAVAARTLHPRGHLLSWSGGILR